MKFENFQTKKGKKISNQPKISNQDFDISNHKPISNPIDELSKQDENISNQSKISNQVLLDRIESIQELTSSTFQNLSEKISNLEVAINNQDTFDQEELSLINDYDAFYQFMISHSHQTGQNSREVTGKGIKFRKSDIFNIWNLWRFLKSEGVNLNA